MDSRILTVQLRAPMIALAAMCLACDGATHTPAASSPQSGTEAHSSGLRIVSLSPAISCALADLGLGPYVVGRTPFCSSLDQSTPVVGDLNSIDYERLVKLAPTHVLVQPPSTGIDPHLRDIAHDQEWRLHAYSLNSLADIRNLVDGLARACQLPDEAGSARLTVAAERISAELLALSRASQSQVHKPARSLLMVVQTQPVTVFGSGTYLDELLPGSGFSNAVSSPGWIQLSLEDVQTLNPDAILLIIDGQQRVSTDPMTIAGPLAETSIKAIRTRSVAVISTPGVLLPSTSVLQVKHDLDSALANMKGREP